VCLLLAFPEPTAESSLSLRRGSKVGNAGNYGTVGQLRENPVIRIQRSMLDLPWILVSDHLDQFLRGIGLCNTTLDQDLGIFRLISGSKAGRKTDLGRVFECSKQVAQSGHWNRG
jgi:hypothetical protein